MVRTMIQAGRILTQTDKELIIESFQITTIAMLLPVSAQISSESTSDKVTHLILSTHPGRRPCFHHSRLVGSCDHHFWDPHLLETGDFGLGKEGSLGTALGLCYFHQSCVGIHPQWGRGRTGSRTQAWFGDPTWLPPSFTFL